MTHHISASCAGRHCTICRAPATHKLGEEIMSDDPMPYRHNLTAYVCCACFTRTLGPATGCVGVTNWYDITPADAKGIDLHERFDITAPLNEVGERCPWPWEPQQLLGAPIGQYHCAYCGAMVIAGMRHIDHGKAGE